MLIMRLILHAEIVLIVDERERELRECTLVIDHMLSSAIVQVIFGASAGPATTDSLVKDTRLASLGAVFANGFDPITPRESAYANEREIN